MADPLNTKDMADILRLKENKGNQWGEEGALPQVMIAGKWLFPRGHILRWIDENVQRERDSLIVGGIISLSLHFMSNDGGSYYEQGFK